MEDKAPEVCTSASNHDIGTIRQAVAFGRHPARAYSINCICQQAIMSLKVVCKTLVPMNTGTDDLLKSRPLSYPIKAQWETQTNGLTFQILPKAKMVSVTSDKLDAEKTHTAPKSIRIAHIAGFSSLKDDVGYNDIYFTRALPAISRK